MSNSFVGAREREEAAHGFGELCDGVVYSHAANAVLVDELPENANGALPAGMTAITFRDNAQAISA